MMINLRIPRLALVMLLMVTSLMLIAGTVQSAPPLDKLTTIINTASRLRALQGMDGGWDWMVATLNSHSTNASANNQYGIEGLGLIDAYRLTGDTLYLTAAGHAAAGIVGKYPYSPSGFLGYSQDYRFMTEYAATTHNANYRNIAINAWNTQKTFLNRYNDGNQTDLYSHFQQHTASYAVWQLSDFGLAALEMGDTVWANQAANIINSHIADISTADISRVDAWGRALSFLSTVDPTAYAGTISVLINELKTNQHADGSWDGGDPDGTHQQTAYAVMGLIAAGEMDLARKGAHWLATHQMANGGWIDHSREAAAADSEALQALYATSAPVVNVTTGNKYYVIQDAVDTASAGDTINVAPGTYAGDIGLGQQLILLALPGAVISGGDNGITATSANGVVINGFIIKDYSKEGIKVYSGNVAISNNVIEANTTPNSSYSEDSIYIKGSAAVTVSSNTLCNNHYAGTLYDPSKDNWSTAAGLSVHDNAVVTAMYNSIYNNDFGIHVKHNTANVIAHYNDIHGNTVYGFFFEGVGGNPSSPFDASLNWWGDVSGPTHASNPAGTGDRVSDHVIFSPWLGVDPDGNPTLAGVQITGPMLIIVDDIGPAPAAGYLNTAIAGANSAALPYTDTIEVKHGTYDASTAITQPVNIVSEPGSAAHTTLNGNVSINSNGVLIGLPLQGFRMNGNVTVGAGNDAGTSGIHWSDLYGNVTNSGTGTFNAQYNYWGTQLASIIDARTTGLVDYTPFLPKNADDSYTDIQALLAAGVAGGIDPAIDQLWLMTRLGQDVSTFIGYAGVAGAGAFAGAPAGGEINLGGAAGGGGAVEGTLSGPYVIGTPITGQFTITDPVTGDPITDAAVTTSLLGPDGGLVFWGCATYDETTGEYVFSVDTTGLAPGTYELIIQTDDGQSKTVSIEVQGA